MRISLNWIKRLLGRDDLGLPADELADRLTLRVAEIEAVETLGGLDGVVVGRVLTCEPHPDADRLRCCTVAVGATDPLPVVCGAPNVTAGQLVAVATVGTELTMPGKDGTPQTIIIKAGKLRGEPSHGMICAEDELGLGNDHQGIMVLTGDDAPGTPLATALGLGDAVLVIDNIAINHRPDLWGHHGWAREVAAVLGCDPPPACDIAWHDTGSGMEVSLAGDGCLAYAGAVITGVGNAPSPAWMQRLLIAAGLRPLGLLVDLTNFVMLELGEPMHAFDRRQIAGESLQVRQAVAGEAFTTLDGKDHVLRATDLLIADRERPLALAGIMGGAGSAVAEDTTTIVLEAACFRAAGIRCSRIASGVATESSNRFEKGLYPELCPAAINLAVHLLREILPDATVTCRFHAGRLGTSEKQVPFDGDLTRRRLGLDLDDAVQRDLLERLGFVGDGGAVLLPWWRRKDVESGVDLVEEVGRLHGYGQIAETLPRIQLHGATVNQLRRHEHRARSILSAAGWDEVLTYVFTSTEWAEALGWPESERLVLVNPLSSEQTVLRRSLLPTLLDAAGRNRRHFPAVSCYEIGTCYQRDGDDRRETVQVVGVCSAADDAPFFTARDGALALLTGLGYAGDVVRRDDDPHLVAGRAATLLIAGRPVGRVGELPPDLLRLALHEGPLACFEIDLQRLLADIGPAGPVRFITPSRFPTVEREFTFVCGEALAYADIATAVAQAAGALHRQTELVTIYRGEQIGPDAKAISLRVVLQSDAKTLSEKDLRKVTERIIRTVEAQTPARLRT